MTTSEYEALSRKLDDILHWVTLTHRATVRTHNIVQGEYQLIMTDLSRIQADVANNTSVTQSAVTLITGLADAIRSAGTDQVALDKLADDLEASSASLAAAVTANTPASPPPAEPPPADTSTGGADTGAG